MPSVTSRAALLLAAAYLALAVHGLGAADIVGDDEAREAGIVQDVVAGHWLLPRFNGEALPDKPPLYYWLAALPCAVAGFSETAVRLPSALAGAALVGGTAAAGARMLGAPAGLAAGALLATMPALATRARVARPDVLLVLLLSAALWAAFRWWEGGRRTDATAALALLGLATLAKGPVAAVLFALTLGGFLVWQRDLRRLRAFPTAAGLVAFAVLGLGWYAVAIAGWGEFFVREHLIGRYVGNLLGGIGDVRSYTSRPWSFHLLFYVKHLPAVALPWTPFTAVALWQAWRADRLGDPRARFLVCWIAAPVIAFTPAEYKLRHYLLPCLPAVALVTAPAVVALWRAPARVASRRTVWLVVATALGGTGVAAAAAALGLLGPLSRSDRAMLDALLPLVPGGAATAAVALGAAAAAVLVALARQAWAPLLAAVGAGAVLWIGAGLPALERAVSARDSLATFGRAVAARYPPPAPCVFFRETIRPVVVYAGRPLPTIRRPRDITPGQGVIAVEAAYRRLADAGVLGPPLAAARGRVGNVARDRVVLAAGTAQDPRSASARR